MADRKYGVSLRIISAGSVGTTTFEGTDMIRVIKQGLLVLSFPAIFTYQRYEYARGVVFFR